MKSISQETIDKISQTKAEDGRTKILLGFVKNDLPQQSTTQLAIPSHRTREWITFDQFKELIAQGTTLKYLNGKYSKHLMAFYSAMSQGKVNLSKEKFEEQYNLGVPLDEIARANNIPREYITYLREFYGIKRKGATYQKRLKNEVPLSQEAKDVIIGSLLGDGHLTEDGYFSEKHSAEQLEYLQWKASFFPHITTNKSWDYYECLSKIGSWEGITKSYCFRTTTHSWIIEMEKLWYKKNDGKRIKIIPKEIEEWMNTQILAVWFMDDGITDWNQRNSKKWNTKPASRFCTDCFSNSDRELLRKILQKRFGLISTPSQARGRIYLTTTSTENLHKIIKPYIHANLIYKVDPIVKNNQ